MERIYTIEKNTGEVNNSSASVAELQRAFAFNSSIYNSSTGGFYGLTDLVQFHSPATEISSFAFSVRAEGHTAYVQPNSLAILQSWARGETPLNTGNSNGNAPALAANQIWHLKLDATFAPAFSGVSTIILKYTEHA